MSIFYIFHHISSRNLHVARVSIIYKNMDRLCLILIIVFKHFYKSTSFNFEYRVQINLSDELTHLVLLKPILKSRKCSKANLQPIFAALNKYYLISILYSHYELPLLFFSKDIVKVCSSKPTNMHKSSRRRSISNSYTKQPPLLHY